MKIIETHIVPAISEKIRLQEYAVSIFDTITTRSAVKKAIKKGLILLNNEPASTSDWIHQGQKIDLLKATSGKKKIFQLAFKVLYEDEFIAVINKPPGYPTSGNYFKTIENALPFNLKISEEKDALNYPLPAHRLDNPTSGILLCAKTRKSLVKLQNDFGDKQIRKYYYALVHNQFSGAMEINEPVENKPAKTFIKGIDTYKIEDEFYSLLEAQPLTGRTHQIRRHLSEKSLPIVGDQLYGIEEKGVFKNRNLYLFAGKIEFKHPIDQKKMVFELPLPKKFRNLKSKSTPP